MLAVAGREKEGWLTLENIDNFPCLDLSIIDKLWVKYSQGKFGFSVQKRIYQSLGGTRDFDQKIWEAFGDRVGWRRQDEWLYYGNVTFDLAAPEAHLPFTFRTYRDKYRNRKGGSWGWCSLASRLVDCNI